MGIHVVKDNKVVEYQKKSVKKEVDIEEFLENHPSILDKEIFIIGRQVPTESKGRIDLLGMDKNGHTVLIEIKKGASTRDAVSQILEYGVWAEKIQYEELNRIAKEKHLKNYPDLYKKFEKEFKVVPEPFNSDQRLYIVAEEIDEKIENIARYLRLRGIDIKCVELNFYENDGQQLVNTNFVVGDESDSTQELGEKSTSEKILWKDRLEIATPANRASVIELISQIEQKFKVKGAPQNRFYYIKIKERERKNLFCCISCQKDSAYVAFRIDPEKFEFEGNPKIKTVRGWFFPVFSERRIPIEKANFALIMQCLEHAYNTTAELE